MKALASRAIVLSCLLFVAILGLASAAEWDVNSYVSTANNPNFGTVMVPHPPIKVSQNSSPTRTRHCASLFLFQP